MPSKHGQRGVFTVVTALSLVALLGSVGLAVDLSRIQVVRSELQSAADACALSAVMELNGAADSPQRGANAGLYVGGQRNNKDFQSEVVGRANIEVSFGVSPSGNFFPAASAPPPSRFARCVVTDASVTNFFMGVLGIGESLVSASATATVRPAVAACTLPMGMCGRPGDNNFGLSVGQRITIGTDSNNGFFTWANVTGNLNNNADYEAAMVQSGVCNASTVSGRCIQVKNGAVTSLDPGWNSRFGVYKASGLDAATAPPDLTGFGYLDTAAEPPGGFLSNYLSHIPGRDPFTGSVKGGYRTPSNNSDYVTSGSSYRRLLPIAVINCSSSCGSDSRELLGWACILMLHPVAPAVGGKPADPAQIAYLGRADDPNSRCRTAGVPGGLANSGPLVPALVQ